MKVLIVDDVHPILVERLTQAGLDVWYEPDIKKEALSTRIPEADVLVVRSKCTLDAKLLPQAGSLKYVARAGSGMDNLDLPWLAQLQIQAENAGEANAQAVAEHSLSLLLSCMHHTARADRQVREKIWDREGNRGEELFGKTIGIIGYGNTGKAFARVLSGFKMKVLAYDKYLRHFSDDFAQEASMEQIWEEARIISFHIPLTAETNGMVSDDYIQSFQHPIRLLNLSRGPIVPMSTVIRGINRGKILSAGLDVLENEDLKSLNPQQLHEFETLTRSHLVVLNPHIGGWSIESYRKISEVLAEKILAFAQSHNV